MDRSAVCRLAIIATPLLAFPRVLSLIFAELLTDEANTADGGQLIRQLNVLERSLATLAGMSCATLGAMLMVHVSQTSRRIASLQSRSR